MMTMLVSGFNYAFAFFQVDFKSTFDDYTTLPEICMGI